MYQIWDFLKDKGINPIARYFIHRNFGQFFLGKIKKEQLSISSGNATIENVALNCETINEKLSEEATWGMEIMEGHVGSFTVKTPWTKMMSGDNANIEIEVINLSATLRPAPKQTDTSTSMMESISSSVTNPIQFAQEYLEGSGEASFTSPDEKIRAIEHVAQSFANVLASVKTKLINTEIRLEYLPPNSDRGIAVIIKIDRIEHENEGGNDNSRNTPTNLQEGQDEDIEGSDGGEHEESQKKHFLSTYTSRHITIEGVQLFTEEFRIAKGTSSSDYMGDSSMYSSTISQLPETEQDIFYENLERTKLDIEKHSRNHPESDNEDVLDMYYSKSILIAKFEGKQEIRIKTKRLDDVSGPTVILDLQLGALNVFLTPRQLHLVNKICDVYLKDPKTSPKTDIVSDKKAKQQQEQQQKSSHHKQQQQQQQYSSFMSGVLGSEGGWADPTEELLQFSKGTPSIYSDISDHQQQQQFKYQISSSTSMTSSCTTASSKYRIKGENSTLSSGDISYFSIDIASVTAVLLQEDILLEDSRRSCAPISEESVNRLIEFTKKFFDEDWGQTSRVMCEKNHLKAILIPVIIKGEEQRTSDMITLNLTTTITTMDFEEVLQKVPTPLIEYQRKEKHRKTATHPEFKFTLKTQTPVGKKNATPKTDIHFNLHPCTIELDITMYDRLSAIVSSSPFTIHTSTYDGSQLRRSEPITEINADAPSIDILFRFPIPDARPIHDPNREPWWKKNVRPDFFLFKIYQFRLKYVCDCIEIIANEIDLYHCENSAKTHVLKATFVGDVGKNVEYPKFLIEFPPEKTLKALLRSSANDSDSGELSGESSKYFQINRDAPPFSSKRVHRSSDTSHETEEETVLLPGDRTELRKFREKSMGLSRLQFKIHLPQVSGQLKSKYFYEIIYNRINTDLLMWKPCAPQYTSNQTLDNLGMTESCYDPSAGAGDDEYELSGGDDEFGSDTDSNFRSACGKRRIKRSQLMDLCGCAFEFTAKEGILTMYAPVRDNENRVIPEQFGEFVFKVENFTLYSVNSYNGDDNLALLSLESTAEIYHCGLISNPENDPPLRLINSSLPDYLQATLYPTPSSLTLGNSRANPKRRQITLVTESRKIPEHRVKRLRLTTGIQGTTLRYNPAPSSHTWVNQLIDMFDVIDYPVEGYKPFGIVTEMQLHLWESSVDYRPKYLPYRAIAEFGTVMISSNVTTSSTGCTLRFIFEDGSISIAPYDDIRHMNDPTNCITVLPVDDLVSVLDYTLLDFSIRINEKATELFPKFDFRASNPEMHLRTCTDSAKAFSDLLLYIAENGDLRDLVDDEFAQTNQPVDREENLLNVNEPKAAVPEITREQQERVTQLITEAIRDQLKISSDSSSDDESKPSVATQVSFVFPDEKRQIDEEQKQKSKDSSSSSASITTATTVRFVNKSKSSESSETQRQKSGIAKRSETESDFSSYKFRDSESDLRDILDFEASVMRKSYHQSFDEAIDNPHPQVREELGELSVSSYTPNMTRRKKKTSRRSSFTPEDDFHMIAEEEREYMIKCGRDIKITDDPLRIVDNHFSLPEGKADLLKAPENFPMAVSRYILCEMSFTWHMYGGHDFPKENDHERSGTCESCEILRTPQSPMSDVYKHGVSYSKDQQRVQFVKNKPKPELSFKTIGGKGRDHDVLVEIQITKARVSHEIYPTTTMQSSRQVFVINELEIRDRLQCSDINKFLYHQQSKLSNKNIHPQIVIKALHIRPDPRLTTQECSLKISSKNLKLNIDQDCLLFLAKFFTELSSSTEYDEDTISRRSVQRAHPPIMMVDDIPSAMQELQAKKMISTNLDLLLQEGEKAPIEKDQKSSSSSSQEEPVPFDIGNDGIYFKDVFFGPDVAVLIDYVGKTRIDNTHGAIAGFIMGLGQLQCSEIRLKKISKHGIKGIDQVLKVLLTEWLKDIKKNQLGDILKGIGAVNTVIQIVQGFVDLFWLPIQQYRRDGRIVRGLQLGAQSFAARTTLAALEITTRIMQILQITAETAYDMLSPGPSVRRLRHTRKGKRKRLYRPRDLREGMVAAYQIVKEGFSETACTFIETTVSEHDQKGMTGAVGAVVRQIPPLVVSPVVYATQATTNVLGGVKCQLIPDAKLEAKDKWKDDTE